ncbi:MULTISPECIES: helix-turn-helix transcriptional regulator [Amycolatopsis]|uniref:Response regulator transcription factor n=1 Tax=Amycolatopsis albidoflavus TaxID=102226 RepID=A0ABW5I8R9_9PSEU
MERIRVAVHSSDPITHAGATSYLRSRPEVHVLPSGRLAEAEVLVVAADVVTAEIMAMLRRAVADSPMRTVLITNELPETDLLTAIECGVVVVLLRSAASGERLISAVMAAAEGRGMLPSDLLGTLMKQVERLQREVLAAHGLNATGLAPREVDVLRLMAEGADTSEIAEQLCYSERTVKNVIYALMNRLNLKNRPHAVAYAMRAGII